MEVYLIRHTTPKIDKGICYGQSDLDLAETFLEEFKIVSSKLPDHFDAYYSSPLKRCLHLTMRLTEKFATDHRLMEYHFGDWELKKWDDIPKAHLDPWMKDFVNVPAPEGESMAVMSERVKTFFSELVAKDYNRVAVITHSVVMRIVLCHVEGKSLTKAFEQQLNYGDIVKVDIDQNTSLYNHIKKMTKTPITVSWSGGKDSAYALYHLLQSGEYEVQSLHTVFDAELKRVGLHGVPEHLITAQAEALDIPLEKIYLPKDTSHASYEQVIKDFCLSQKAKGINHVMYGDIFLEDLKSYRDKQLASVGLTGVYPIWKRDTRSLVKEFVNDGFKTVVCAANAALFDKSKVGKTIDHNWLEQLADDVDPCGENGEFHTFVYAGPLFKKEVAFKRGEVVDKSYEYNKKEDDGTLTPMKSTFWFQELL